MLLQGLALRLLRQLNVSDGFSIRATPFTDQFIYDDFVARYRERSYPLFLIHPAGALTPIDTERSPVPVPGDRMIALTWDG